MNEVGSSIHNISDTARWAAFYRARECDRPDAVFRDHLARRLAGERGEQIATTMPFSEKQAWTWVTRTYLFDQFVTEQVAQGVDMVLNLAAGLDARPYRMALPPSLRWVEVDLPELLAYKEEVLKGEKPVCDLERIRLDLSNVNARREVFDRLGQAAQGARDHRGPDHLLYSRRGRLACRRPRAACQLPAVDHRRGIPRFAGDVAEEPGRPAFARGRGSQVRPRRRAGFLRSFWLDGHRRAVHAQDGSAG